MRESIGGTMLFWIVLFFMSLFITFLASVIQYARVYKIKNSLVNYLEQSEGISSQEEFENALNSLGYPNNGKYVICRYNAGSRGGYYYVKLYASFEIMGIAINVSISGETRLIETGVFIESDDWFQYSENGNCFGRRVSQNELTRVG